MTIDELATRLEPIVNDTLAAHDPVVKRISVILAAVMGCIAEDTVDDEALEPLVLTAGRICEHRIGRHHH